MRTARALTVSPSMLCAGGVSAPGGCLRLLQGCVSARGRGGAWSRGCYRVPTRTGKPGKPGKMGRHFPVREKSGNFEQTGKVREKSGKITQNTGKLREFEINIIDILSAIKMNCVLFVKMDQVFILKKIKH